MLDSSVHGILQARILEWVAISSPGALPDSGIEPASPALAGRFFSAEPPGKPIFLPAELAQNRNFDKPQHWGGKMGKQVLSLHLVGI